MIDDDPGAEMCQFLEAFHAMCELHPARALEGLLYWAMQIQHAEDRARRIEAESEHEERVNPDCPGRRA